MVKFLHIRNKQDENNYNAKGGYTIAFKLTDPKTQTWEINFSKCSNKDFYNKKRGREIAGGRLEKNGGCLNYIGSKPELIKELFNMAEDGAFSHV